MCLMGSGQLEAARGQLVMERLEAAAPGTGAAEGMKMAVLLRTDVGMSAGKAAAQACHAALRTAREAPPDAEAAWRAMGEKIVVLACPDQATLRALVRRARDLGVPVSAPIRDAGLTEVAPGTETAVAVGPALASTVDLVTGALRAFR